MLRDSLNVQERLIKSPKSMSRLKKTTNRIQPLALNLIVTHEAVRPVRAERKAFTESIVA